MNKEYKQLKVIRLQDILELDEGPFRIECLNRLEKCGFIEKEATLYEPGQRFRCEDKEYILANLGHKQVALVNLGTGYTRSGIKSVQDPRAITQADLKELKDFGSSSIELIE